MAAGGHPIQAFYLGIPGNATIAASMGGTAAATLISTSVSATYFRFMEVWNMTGRNLEIGFGNDNGTASYVLTTPGSTPITVGANSQIFCPGTTASSTGAGRGNYFPITLQQGSKIWARTTENTPITAASTTPLVINFWA